MADNPLIGSLDYGGYPAPVYLTPGTYDPTKETVNDAGVISSIVAGTAPSMSALFTLQTSAVTPVTMGAGNVAFFGSAGAGADQVINLPAATGSAFIKIIKKDDANAHYLTLTPNGADTIDGNPSYSLGVAQNDAMAIMDAAAGRWRVLFVYAL